MMLIISPSWANTLESGVCALLGSCHRLLQKLKVCFLTPQEASTSSTQAPVSWGPHPRRGAQQPQPKR